MIDNGKAVGAGFPGMVLNIYSTREWFPGVVFKNIFYQGVVSRCGFKKYILPGSGFQVWLLKKYSTWDGFPGMVLKNIFYQGRVSRYGFKNIFYQGRVSRDGFKKYILPGTGFQGWF